MLLLWGNPERGFNPTMLCSLWKGPKCGCRGGLAASAGGGPDQGARGADPRDTLHGTLSRQTNHPRRGHAPAAGTNGRDNTRLDARRCCLRHHRRACASSCRAGDLAPAGYSRARRRLRLRLRHRNCSTTGSFEARLHETRSRHFRDSRCASRSRERTMACCFTSRLRISPIPYPRCVPFRLEGSHLFMSM